MSYRVFAPESNVQTGIYDVIEIDSTENLYNSLWWDKGNKDDCNLLGRRLLDDEERYTNRSHMTSNNL